MVIVYMKALIKMECTMASVDTFMRTEATSLENIRKASDVEMDYTLMLKERNSTNSGQETDLKFMHFSNNISKFTDL